MAALMSTMFVTPPPKRPSFLHRPARSAQKPLTPVSTLVQSHSCSHFGQVSTAPHGIWAADAEAALAPLKNIIQSSMGKPASRDPVHAEDDLVDVPLSPQLAVQSSPCPLSYLFGTPGDVAMSESPPPRSSLAQCDDSPFSRAQQASRRSIVDFLMDRNARGQRPFRPQRANKGTTSWQLRQYAEATLGSQSLRKVVKLPEGEDINEWLAVNVVDFYNQINLLYGSITEFCSPQTCPEMKATDEFEYLWQDSENFKRPTKMPAPEYIEHLMAWCQSNIDNEQMFPSRIGVPFPKTFSALIRQMFKRLYRIYAHIYCHHYPVIIQLGLEPHLNTSFKHYVLFIDEHALATGKDFWGPLGDLVDSMLKSD